MIKFSVLIATRMRIEYLKNLLESIYQTTRFKDEIEVLVAYDDNDVQTSQFITTYNPPKNYDANELNVSFLKRPRSININGDYYNWMANHFSKGEYIIVCNDDAVFVAGNWDETAWNKLEAFKKAFPDGIVLGITEDQDHVPYRDDYNRFTCFPLFSRKDLEVLGFLFQPEYWRDGADWVIAAVYRRIERILDLRREIAIKHISVRSRRRERDELYDEYTRLCHECPSPPTADVVTRDVNILQHYIDYGEILTADQVQWNK